MRRVLPVCAAWFVVACGGDPRRQPPPRSSLLEAEPRSAALSSIKPGWMYHPSDTGLLVARAALKSGETLFAGQRGERWRVGPGGGAAEAAADLAPEELVAIVQPAERRPGTPGEAPWLFVGKSGTTYEAREPLGVFARSSAPLEPLVRVREGGGVLMGLRRDGSLARSDTAGSTWAKVGPEEIRFEDVALRGDGRGLALAIPEALYESRNYGASWQRTALPTLGIVGLAQDDGAGVVAQGALGSFAWQPDARPSLVPLGRAVSAHSYSLGVPLPVGPSADALNTGRAVVTGSTWLEARPGAGLTWNLVWGRFGQRLRVDPLPSAKGCETVFLAAFERETYLACARQKGEDRSQPIEFQRSTNAGRSFEAEPYYVVGRTGEFAMAAGAGGALAVTGVCPGRAHEAGCVPTGVHRRQRTTRDSGPEFELLQSATPSLVRAAYDLVFSIDGRTLFAIGRRLKSDSLSVFVSHDGGATFEGRDVEPLRLSQDEDDTRARLRTENPVRSSAPGPDGTSAFVVALSGQQFWLDVDDDGHAVSLVKPPIPNARLGAAGSLGFVIDPISRDAYESLDAGAHFKPMGRLPSDPCLGAQFCDVRIACTALGCAIGNSVTRVGWRVEGATTLPPDSKDHGALEREPRVAAPLSCSLGPGEWQKIPSAVAMPTARDAAIGKIIWFAVAVDPRTASGSVVHMKAGATPRVEVIPLLDASRAPSKDVFVVSPRTGGAVGIRYTIPAAGSGPELKHVEIAWDDVFAGRTGHAFVDDGGTLRPSDYGDGKGHANSASIAFSDLANGGVYLRLHSASGDDQPTLFVTAKGTEATPAVLWPEEVRQKGRAVMAHLGAAHVPVHVDGPATVRARQGDRNTWSFDAVTLGWNRAVEFGLGQRQEAMRFGDRFGVLVTTFDTAGVWARGLIYPLRADGGMFDEPVPVATQFDLANVPRACNAADRAASPRVVVPYQTGTRHPVLVTDPVEPMRVLLTGDAVLYGAPSSACAAAYDATVVPESASVPAERAIISVDALDRSWLFRFADGSRDQPRSLEYRAMSCRFDPTSEKPPEVKGQNGT